MTLARRLGIHLSLLIACLAVTALVGLAGVAGVRQDFSVALDNYERLRGLYQVGFHLQAARLTLRSTFPDREQARLEIRRAVTLFERIAGTLPSPPGHVLQTRNDLAAAAAAAEAARPSPKLADASLGSLRVLEDALRVQIQDHQAAADARTRRTIITLAVAAGIAVLLGILIGVRQFRAVMAPLSAIAGGTRRVAAGAFDQPIQLRHADDEFAAVAADFNAMSERLRLTYTDLQVRVESATRSALQSERLAGVGLLAAGVAHEINNPLSIITGRLELILARPGLEQVLKEQIEVLLEEAFRCKQIIDRLLLLSRGPSGQRRRQPLGPLVEDFIASVRTLPAVEARSIAAQIQPVEAAVDEGEIRQVLLNLLINAIRFTQPNGRIDVRLQRDGQSAELVVADDGAGMDTETLQRLFEPFFSRSSTGQRGTGLGLAISRAIVEAHGGVLEAHSGGEGKGSRFVVRLPVADDVERS